VASQADGPRSPEPGTYMPIISSTRVLLHEAYVRHPEPSGIKCQDGTPTETTRQLDVDATEASTAHLAAQSASPTTTSRPQPSWRHHDLRPHDHHMIQGRAQPVLYISLMVSCG
jgi:hypothetical protein